MYYHISEYTIAVFSTIVQWTPLHTSSLSGHSQVVGTLLSQPEIEIDSRDEVQYIHTLTYTHTHTHTLTPLGVVSDYHFTLINHVLFTSM